MKCDIYAYIYMTTEGHSNMSKPWDILLSEISQQKKKKSNSIYLGLYQTLTMLKIIEKISLIVVVRGSGRKKPRVII